jgi:hypothetical protein
MNRMGTERGNKTDRVKTKRKRKVKERDGGRGTMAQ